MRLWIVLREGIGYAFLIGLLIWLFLVCGFDPLLRLVAAFLDFMARS